MGLFITKPPYAAFLWGCGLSLVWLLLMFTFLRGELRVSPAATHFSCFAKKSKQKKVTQKPLPAARVPKANDHQSGAQTNSPSAQTGLRSLSD